MSPNEQNNEGLKRPLQTEFNNSSALQRRYRLKCYAMVSFSCHEIIQKNIDKLT